MAGIGYYVWMTFQNGDYAQAVAYLGISLIGIGFILRRVFKEPPQKL
jgi:hypothetical protein